MELNRASVLITGGSRGIGAELARVFSARGANVVVAARSEGLLESLAAEIGGHAVPVDLSDESQVDALIPRVEELVGPLDVLVNNAGVETMEPAAVIDPDLIRTCTRVNLEAPMVLTRHVLPGMVRRDRGHIVFSSSLAGTASFPGLATYAGTKAGLTNFASTVRAELKNTEVAVTIMAAGPVDTDMWDHLEQSQARNSQQILKRFNRLHLLPKADAVEVASRIVRAVESGRRHVRDPKRLSTNYWLNEAPRLINEAVLAGVRFDPLEGAD